MNEDTEISITDPPVAMNTMTKIVLSTSTSGHDTRGMRTNRAEGALMNVKEKMKRTRGVNCPDPQMIRRMRMSRRKK
jgi:hypothetical protein